MKSAKGKLDDDGVFQIIFKHYCSRFTRNTAMVLENSSYMSFVTDTPKLLDKTFTFNDASLVYNRMKDNELNHVIYSYLNYIQSIY